MRTVLLITIAILAAAAPSLAGGQLPPEFSYTIYIEGEDAGKCATKVTETDERYVFDTQTVVQTEDINLDLTSKTEVDKQSFLPVRFTFGGRVMDRDVVGETTINGREATCVNMQGDREYTIARASKHDILILEEYVMAHEVVIARAFWESGEDPASFGLLFPSPTNITTIDITKGSELAFESATEEAYCVKLIISLQGGSPFASFYDPERGLPLYLAFPTTATEAFLDEFFDGEPVSRYRKP